MRPRTLLNLGLLVLLALLVALAVYEPGIAPEAEQARLTARTAQDITRIEIQRRDHSPIRLQKEGQQWWLLTPLRMPANEALVRNILAILASPSKGPYAIGKLNPAEAGLADSRLTLRLDDIEIRFGNRNPLDQQRYVQLGDQVHLIADTLSHRLSDTFTDYVSLRLLPEASQPADITLPHQRLAQEDGRWQLTPPDAAISADDIQAYVDAWKHAWSLKVAPYQAGPVEGVFTLKLAGTETPVRLDILATDPELILGRKDLGVQYHMGDVSTARLMRVQPVPAQSAPVKAD